MKDKLPYICQESFNTTITQRRFASLRCCFIHDEFSNLCKFLFLNHKIKHLQNHQIKNLNH